MTAERYIQPDPHAMPIQRWVAIERQTLGGRDLYLGPFESEEAATLALEESLLVQSELDPPNGGTDAIVHTAQPDPERDEIVLIDHNDPHHTGRPSKEDHMTQPEPTTIPPVRTAETLRIVADYQLMSDDEGVAWMTATLTDAKDRGLIAGYQVLGSYPGLHGLQHVAFTVDVRLGAVGIDADQSWDEAKDSAEDLLNGPIVPDSDVQVRWLSPVFDERWEPGFGPGIEDEPTALAYTPDHVIEEGQRRLAESHPGMAEAFVAALDAQNPPSGKGMTIVYRGGMVDAAVYGPDGHLLKAGHTDEVQEWLLERLGVTAKEADFVVDKQARGWEGVAKTLPDILGL